MERETGIEPATSSLGSLPSTLHDLTLLFSIRPIARGEYFCIDKGPPNGCAAHRNLLLVTRPQLLLKKAFALLFEAN